MKNINNDTVKVLQDLKNDIERMLNASSNMEVVWGLEVLHHQKALLKSADDIRKSLENNAKII
jgi:hypothetical protein